MTDIWNGKWPVFFFLYWDGSVRSRSREHSMSANFHLHSEHLYGSYLDIRLTKVLYRYVAVGIFTVILQEHIHLLVYQSIKSHYMVWLKTTCVNVHTFYVLVTSIALTDLRNLLFFNIDIKRIYCIFSRCETCSGFARAPVFSWQS